MTCPTPQKAAHPTRHAAQRALGRVQSRRRRYGDAHGTRRGLQIENRTYLCTCEQYHLTHRSRREVAA